jgi:hypothetical protein
MRKLKEQNGLTTRSMYRLGIRTLLDAIMEPGVAGDISVHEYARRCSSARYGLNSVMRKGDARRVCPLCVSEGRDDDVGKELIFADACIVHEVWLVNQCTECGIPLSYSDEDYGCCSKCGIAVGSFRTTVAPDSVTNMARILHRAMTDGNATFSVFHQLDSLGWNRLIRYLLDCQMQVCGSERHRSSAKLDMDWIQPGRQETLTAAAQMLVDWPLSFKELIARADTTAEQSMGTSLKRLGPAYRLAFALGSSLDISPIKAAIEDYIAERWVGAIGQRNRRLQSDVIDTVQGNWVNISTACKQLAVSRARIARDIADGRLEAREYVGESGRKFTYISGASLQELRRHRESRLCLTQLEELLGPSHQLLKAALPALGAPEPGPRNTKLFSKGLVAELLERLPTNEIDLPLPDDYVSFRSVLQSWRWSGEELNSFLTEFKNGDVVPIGLAKGESGFSALIFKRDALAPFSRARALPDDELSLPDLAVYLGRKQELIYWLAKVGALKTRIVTDGKKRRFKVATLAQVQVFRQKFVFLSDIAPSLNTSARTLGYRLEKLGIHPEYTKYLDQNARHVYLRSEQLENAFLEIARQQAVGHSGVARRSSRKSATTQKK